MNKNCGIYLIKNEINNKVYVGSSKNIKSRIWHHKNCLKHNRHTNEHLQNAWNRYREASFTHDTLECCAVEELFAREKFWMELFESYNKNYGYNIARVTINGGPGHSEATKIRISKGRKKWHKENPEKSNSKRVKVVNFRTSPFTWKDFSSITEALEYHKINKNHISSYTNKRTFKDLAFVTLDSPNAYNRLKKIYIRWLKNNNETYYTKAEPIYALNLITNQIEVFPSQNQFRKKTGRNLNPTILNKAHKVGNYRPAYKREYLERWMES